MGSRTGNDGGDLLESQLLEVALCVFVRKLTMPLGSKA